MDEHAVLLTFKLSDGGLGTAADFDKMRDLSNQLDAAISEHRVGEFDGNEMGAGECILFMYGPNIDKLYAAIEPILQASPFVRGGTVTKRYGAIGDPLTQETTLKL